MLLRIVVHTDSAQFFYEDDRVQSHYKVILAGMVPLLQDLEIEVELDESYDCVEMSFLVYEMSKVGAELFLHKFYVAAYEGHVLRSLNEDYDIHMVCNARSGSGHHQAAMSSSNKRSVVTPYTMSRKYLLHLIFALFSKEQDRGVDQMPGAFLPDILPVNWENAPFLRRFVADANTITVGEWRNFPISSPLVKIKDSEK